jgi:hypothetical protein
MARERKCVTLETRQFFRLAAVGMALVLLYRSDDPWVRGVGYVTLAVDGYLFLVRSKECP